MQAWTGQPGYPLLHADADDTGIHLRQERFIVNPATMAAKDSQLWPVPLLATVAGLPDRLDSESVRIDIPESNRLKFNKGNSGFYRTVYNATHLQILAQQVKTGHLEPLDRLGILADATEAAKSGKTDAAEVLNLLKSYQNEDDNAVWDVMAGTIGSIRFIMDNEEVREALKPLVRKLTARQVKRLGWSPEAHESHFDRLLRPTILGMASASDESEVVAYALERFADMHDPSEIKAELRGPGFHAKLRNDSLDPDLRGVVYGTAARRGGEAEFNKMWAMHNHTHSNEEKLNLCSALTGFEQPELVARALSLITTEYIRLQDVPYWIAYSFANRHARQAAWEWLKKNWGWLEEHLGTDLSFYRMPIYVARGFSDEKFIDEYKKFFGKVLSPAFERSYNQGLEMIEWQSAWKKRDLMLVKAFLRAN
jgi:aminopeptidase N